MLLHQFLSPSKGDALGPPLTDTICQWDICPANICPEDIFPWQQYWRCYWPNLDQSFWTKYLWRPKFILNQKKYKNFGATNFFWILFLDQNFCCTNIFLAQNCLDPNFFLPKIFFLTQNCFQTQKLFGIQQFFRQNFFWDTKCFSHPTFFPS